LSETHGLAEQAVELFKGGFYCSEAILQVFNKRLNLRLSKTAIKMASGFGAGFGEAKCCCGSLTGAIMVLSAIKGRTSTKDDVEEVFTLSQELHDTFKKHFKATCCRVLTKDVKWGTPEHHKHCEKMVYGAVEILVDILIKSGQKELIDETHKMG